MRARAAIKPQGSGIDRIARHRLLIPAPAPPRRLHVADGRRHGVDADPWTSPLFRCGGTCGQASCCCTGEAREPVTPTPHARGVAHKKNRAARGAARLSFMSAREADNHLPEGNHCPRRPAIWEDSKAARVQYLKSMITRSASRNALSRWSAMRASQDDLPCAPRKSVPEGNVMRSDQKVQRCAFDTRKSRNTCTRATDLSSSG
jgi:hypothetical protein